MPPGNETAPPVRTPPAGRRGSIWRAMVSARVIPIGFGAGLINGLLGLGGGILIVPGMIFFRGVNARIAVSTSLAAVLLLSLVALLLHLAISGFSLSRGGAALLIVGGIFGSQVGGWLLNRVAQRWVILSFSGIALFSSAHLIAGALGVVPSLSTAEPFLWVYPLIGVFSGFFSGFLGVGGGGLAILALSIGFHVEVLQGLPLALAVNVTNALGGVLAQRGTSNIRWREVFQIFPAALVGIGAGTAVALTLPPDALRIVFGLFFIYMGTMLLRKGLQKNGRKGDAESGI